MTSSQNFIIYWLPFTVRDVVPPEVELLLCTLCTAMWILGTDEVTKVDLAERMLLFVYKLAPSYFGESYSRA